MGNTQYLSTLTIFFFSYAVFEVPSNLFLKRLRPSIWLSGLMLLWGVMMTLQRVVTNYGGLLTMRWWLGVFEAGLVPGVNHYLSCWYKRTEWNQSGPLLLCRQCFWCFWKTSRGRHCKYGRCRGQTRLGELIAPVNELKHN